MDSRIKKLAEVIVRYSNRVKKGDSVVVQSDPLGEPLVLAIYEELLSKRAYPIVRMAPDGLPQLFFAHGKSCHLDELPPYAMALAKQTDVLIAIRAARNTRDLSGVDPKKQARYAKTTEPLHKIRRKKPWLLTVFPTEAYAQDADMSLGEFEDFVYHATFADRKDPIAAWKELSRKQAKLISRLKGADQIRIEGDETDLTLSVKGRTFANSDGSEHNMPSGEIYTGPIETSAEGTIKYDFPLCRYGREISGIRLVFKKGVVVDATAEKNEKVLLAMLNIDEGARRLGELGIGANMGIQRFVKNLLFDEKIGGTVHLALGSSIQGTGGRNKSAIHWDMIKDLRQGGALYVDGKVFMKDGKFRS